MNFSDTLETTADGARVVFTVEQKRALHEAGLPIEIESLSQLKQTGRRKTSAPAQTTRSRRESDVPEPEVVQFDPATGKYLGRLKVYISGKGYGFIARGGGETIFFHKSRTLTDPGEFDKGDWLLYDVIQTRRGEEAVDVEPFTGEPPQ